MATMRAGAAARTFAWSLATGVIAAALARLAMHGVAVAGDKETHFTIGGSIGIAMLFVLAALAAGFAGLARWPIGWRLLLAGPPALLLIYGGIVIGSSELDEATSRELDTGSWVQLVALTCVIGLAAIGTPVVAWRLGHRFRAQPSS